MTTATAYTVQYFLNCFSACIDAPSAKQLFRKLCREFHPDLHPELGQEPMKALNIAYESTLKKFDGKSYQERNTKTQASQEKTYRYDASYESFVAEVIRWACTLDGCYVELRGAWLWVGGDTRQHAAHLQFPGEGMTDTRKTFKDCTYGDVRFQWSSKQKEWYLDTTWYYTGMTAKKRASGYSKDEIRSKYGSQTFKTAEATV